MRKKSEVDRWECRLIESRNYVEQKIYHRVGTRRSLFSLMVFTATYRHPTRSFTPHLCDLLQVDWFVKLRVWRKAGTVQGDDVALVKYTKRQFTTDWLNMFRRKRAHMKWIDLHLGAGRYFGYWVFFIANCWPLDICNDESNQDGEVPPRNSTKVCFSNGEKSCSEELKRKAKADNQWPIPRPRIQAAALLSNILAQPQQMSQGTLSSKLSSMAAPSWYIAL